MASLDPHDRQASLSLSPTLITTIVCFIVLLLFGLLFEGVQFAGRANGTMAIPGEDRLAFAERAFRHGQNETAMQVFFGLAAKNDGNAEYWLGHMTELGLGLPADPQAAIALYQKAADQHVIAAELRLGEIYMRGDIVPPDFAKAEAYLQRAAYHADPRAALHLSEMHRLGLGMPADPVKACAWSEVAVLEGNSPQGRRAISRCESSSLCSSRRQAHGPPRSCSRSGTKAPLKHA